MSWQLVEIGDIGRIVTGDTPPKRNPEYYGSAYPFIKPTDMKIDHRHTFTYEEGYSEVAYEKYHRKLIPAGATAVVTIGSIGQKLTLTHTPCFVNQAVNAVIPNEENFNSLYVYYLLKHNLQLIKSADTGASSGRENVSKSNFSKIRVLATLDIKKQDKIALILDGYDSLIENNHRRITLLEESVRILYREWFINLRYPNTQLEAQQLPSAWKIKPLSEIALVNRASLHTRAMIDSIQYIDISSVETGAISTVTRMSYANAPGRARRLVQHGDVIWSCVRPNRRSYALLWEPDDDVVVSTGMAVLTATQVPFTYLYLATTTDEFVEYLCSRATGSTYPAVNAKVFEEAPVLCPAPQVLAKFHEKCLPIFEFCSKLYLQNSYLKEARDALLPKLMSGEIQI